jgi:hypothetical protein
MGAITTQTTSTETAATRRIRPPPAPEIIGRSHQSAPRRGGQGRRNERWLMRRPCCAVLVGDVADLALAMFGRRLFI